MRLRTQLAAALVAAAFPLTLLIVVIVTASASSSVRDARESVLVEIAGRVASDVDAFTFERRRDLQQIAAALGSSSGDPLAAPGAIAAATEMVRRFQATSTAFRVLELVNRDGHILAAAPESGAFSPADRSWFRDTLEGSGATSPRYRAGDTVRWVVAEPVRDRDGAVVAVLAGDVEPRALDPLLAATAIRRGGVAVVDHDRATVASRGARAAVLPSRVAAASLGSGRGPIRAGRLIAGVAPARAEGWGVAVVQDRAVVLEPVADLRNTAFVSLAVAFVLLVVFGLFFARGALTRWYGEPPAGTGVEDVVP